MILTEPDQDDFTVGVDIRKRRGQYLGKGLYCVAMHFCDLCDRVAGWEHSA